MDSARHGIFLINSGNDSFFAAALADGRLRYDPGCMMPCDARARHIVEYFSKTDLPTAEHAWNRPSQLLVIDNRRALHARASAADEPQREVQRLSFHLNREAS